MSEGPVCRVCGSLDTSPLFPGTGLGLHRCRACGAAFRPGRVSRDDLAALYNEDYFRSQWPGSLGRFFGEFDPKSHHKTRFFTRQLQYLEGRRGGPGSLLDVGCANGVFVWMARARGWDAEGVELSPFAAAWGRKQFGVVIHEGGLHDLPLDREYDVISFWDSLEHLPDPIGALHAAHGRLAEGGQLAILTPDESSLVNRLVRGLHRVRPARAAPLLARLYHRDHLSFFTREALSLALIRQGYEIHWIEGYDEDPRDTETEGLMRSALFVIALAAGLLGRRHEFVIFAVKPAERLSG